MARNRQRAKQRQAERRAARLSERESEAPAAGGDDPEGARSQRSRMADPDATEGALLDAPAPPEDVGRSDTVVEAPPPAPVADGEELGDPDDDFDEEEFEAADADGRGGDGGEPAGRDGGAGGRPERQPAQERGRVAAFLAAVVAELRRVQWPDRQALTTLTGVVLGFVLIAGGYLGLLDAIVSRVIQGIL